MTPPVIHKVIENCTENRNIVESKNPFTIDSSICPATQTVMAITGPTTNGTSNAMTQLDNGDLVHANNESNINNSTSNNNNSNCNEIL